MKIIRYALIATCALSSINYAFAKSANECDQEIPPYIKGKSRQHHISNCLLISVGQPPVKPTTFELPKPHEFPTMEVPNEKEWKYITSRSDGNMDVYINARTITKSGHIYRAWDLKNYIEDQKLDDGKKYKSIKTLQLFNCQERSMATVSVSYHENQIGRGNVVENHNFTDGKIFTYASPESIGDEMLKYVCRFANNK